MFRIAICDEEEYFRKKIESCMAEYMEEKGFLYQVDTFSSGKEILSLGIEIAGYTVVFLDINMEEISGFAVAKQIRKVSREISIVFVTDCMNYTLEGYKVNALRYILKGSRSFRDTMNECMDAVIEKKNYRIIKKTFRFNEGEKQIPLERLLYIESKLHKLEFHVMEEELKIYTVYKTLNEIEDELKGNGFIRIHQSFLVNMKYVKDVFRYKVTLSNDMELGIPKARYKYVKDTIVAYRDEI